MSYVKHCQITQYYFYLASLLADLTFTANQSICFIVKGRFAGQLLTTAWRMLWVVAIFVGIYLEIHCTTAVNNSCNSMAYQCNVSGSNTTLIYATDMLLVVEALCFSAWGLLTIVSTLYPQSLVWVMSWFWSISPVVFAKLHAQHLYSSKSLFKLSLGYPL